MANISEIKVWPITSGVGKIKANGSFLVDEAFKIKYTVRAGPKGLFVGFPGKYGKDKEGKDQWYSDVLIIDDDVRKDVSDKVLAAYNKRVGNNSEQGQSPEPSSQIMEDGVPF